MNKISDKTVLICDDEINIRESIRYAVEKEGYQYKMVADGIAAYNTANSVKPDLVILDVGMPGMTGYEVCKKLRELPEMKQTKILILTAYGQASDKIKAFEAGATDFMTKPFSPRELRLKLNELLAEKI
jgi:DNA-binding response OmpR family regulator